MAIKELVILDFRTLPEIILSRNSFQNKCESHLIWQLLLFLNAAMVAKVLGVSPPSGCELIHKPDFPVRKVGSRMVVPKEKFVEWVEQHTNGGSSR